MQVEMFDVGRGFCAYVIADNGNTLLIDCGHNADTGFRPSEYLVGRRCTGIERLVVSNYDEDHVSDLPNLRARLPISVLYRNRSLDVDVLLRLKLQRGPLAPGMASLIDMIRTYNQDVLNPPQLGGVEMATFYNSYPLFDDTNNLSVVTFVHSGDIHIAFPGDLETAGWRALLQQQDFRTHLARVNVFVASHHGRESGYCEEVFLYCRPRTVIVSDEPVQYYTQQTDYRQHAAGVPSGNTTRYVYTTRNDGHITLRQVPGGAPTIATSRS